MTSTTARDVGVALLLLSITVPASAVAQAPSPVAGAPAVAAPIRSPEVQSDRRITFRLAAPSANDVSLRFDEGTVQTHAMTRDGAGIWSVTIGPVEPELYIYNFVVDGLRVLDLANTNLKSGTALASNVVEVPGTPARFDEGRSVPHGSVNIHPYESAAQNTGRTMYVYVPDEDYTEKTKDTRSCTCTTAVGGWKRTGCATAVPRSSWTISSRPRKPCR